MEDQHALHSKGWHGNPKNRQREAEDFCIVLENVVFHALIKLCKVSLHRGCFLASVVTTLHLSRVSPDWVGNCPSFAGRKVRSGMQVFPFLRHYRSTFHPQTVERAENTNGPQACCCFRDEHNKDTTKLLRDGSECWETNTSAASLSRAKSLIAKPSVCVAVCVENSRAARRMVSRASVGRHVLWVSVVLKARLDSCDIHNS